MLLKASITTTTTTTTTNNYNDDNYNNETGKPHNSLKFHHADFDLHKVPYTSGFMRQI